MQRQDSTSWSDNLPVLLGTGLALIGFALVVLHGLSTWGRIHVEVPTVAPPAAVVMPPISVPLTGAPSFSIPVVPEAPAAALDPAIAEEAAPIAEVAAAPPPVREIAPPGRASQSTRLLIPRIAVDSAIVDVALKNGEWPVPRFIVGHLAESAQPGEVGNAVYAGHLLSISAGNVFARLKDLEVGDEMAFFAEDADRVYRVIETKVVRNTDVSVLAERPGQMLVTLITCEGTWLPREQDYSHRRIVVAEAKYH